MMTEVTEKPGRKIVFMTTKSKQAPLQPAKLWAVPAMLFLLLLTGGCVENSPSRDADRQRTFASPEEAVEQLAEACRADDSEALIAIFGEEYRDTLVSSDPSADRQGRAKFAAFVEEKLSIEPMDGGGFEIVAGNHEWPAPIPLIEEKGRWRFDSATGIEEMINRQIGRNELDAIELLHALVAAQHLYAKRDWDGDERFEFAQRFFSREGAHDGLYWSHDSYDGVPKSPLTSFVADERDYADGREGGDPWRGYRLKILTAQGANAPGGALSYLDGEDLTGGFAAIAVPADYGISGIMTFLVGQDGTIHEKDLGEDSLDRGFEITTFDPDGSWTVVD